MSLDPMNLLMVLAAALAGGWVAQRLGYPSILGELAAGIVLGPPLLGLLGSDDAISVIGKLGVTLLMLYIGIHLDPSALGKAAKPGLLASLGGFLVPAGLGFGLMMLADGDPVAAAFVAVAMGVTSLATKSRILVDLGILNTRIAHVLMAGALFSDVAALVFFAALLGLAATGAIALTGILATIGKAVLFLAAAWVVGTRVLPRIGAVVERRRIDPSVLFIGVVGVGLAYAAAAELAGLHGILGAFLAGLFIGPKVLGHDRLHMVETRARNISVGLLAPVFFVTAGFKVSFSVFTESLPLVIAVIVVATVGKIVGTALFYLPSGYGFREGIAVGAGMNGRGAVEIIVAEIALGAGIIDERVFSILVFMAVFTTATVPVLLTGAINWLRRRGELAADDRDGIVVVGAGPAALQIARRLATTTQVTLIDTNRDHVRAARQEGFEVFRGNALDDDALDEAGATSARCLIAVTTNAEVNLLTARLARQRFGVPSVAVTLPDDATSSMMRMLEEVGAQRLFGRSVDLTLWDAAAATDQLVDLEYDVADPEEVFAAPARGNHHQDLEVLPLVVRSEHGWDVFASGHEIRQGDVILALGMNPTRHSTRQAAAPEGIATT